LTDVIQVPPDYAQHQSAYLNACKHIPKELAPRRTLYQFNWRSISNPRPNWPERNTRASNWERAPM